MSYQYCSLNPSLLQRLPRNFLHSPTTVHTSGILLGKIIAGGLSKSIRLKEPPLSSDGGLCFDFLPIFGESGSLRYQRTDKSVGLHLFCWPPDHWSSISKQNASCRFSCIGQTPRAVEAQLLHAFYEAQELFVPWFQNCCNLRNALVEAKRQRTDRNSQYNWPSPDYVTAFLSAANGDTQTGVKILDEFWLQQCQGLPDDLHNKLREKLLACANLKV